METLKERYERLCKTPSDINEHLKTLYTLANECRVVTEMGTRHGVSTTALLYAEPEYLYCYDVHQHKEVDELLHLAELTWLIFEKKNVLEVTIQETDMLFIDTYHTAEQITKELELHAGKVSRYLVFHDTVTFGRAGEGLGTAGIWEPIRSFIGTHPEWVLKEHFQNNNGLAILERI